MKLRILFIALSFSPLFCFSNYPGTSVKFHILMDPSDEKVRSYLDKKQYSELENYFKYVKCNEIASDIWVKHYKFTPLTHNHRDIDVTGRVWTQPVDENHYSDPVDKMIKNKVFGDPAAIVGAKNIVLGCMIKIIDTSPQIRTLLEAGRAIYKKEPKINSQESMDEKFQEIAGLISIQEKNKPFPGPKEEGIIIYASKSHFVLNNPDSPYEKLLYQRLIREKKKREDLGKLWTLGIIQVIKVNFFDYQLEITKN